MVRRGARYLAGIVMAVLISACDGGTTVSELTVTDAWTRPTPAGSTVAAVYLTITSPVDDELIAVSTPVAGSAALHSASASDAAGGSTGHEGHNGGSPQMVMEESTLSFAANATVELVPGGLHVMLTDVAHRLQEGETFPLTLIFASGASETVDVLVALNGLTDG